MRLFGVPDVEKLTAKRDVEGLIKLIGSRQVASARVRAADALGELADARAVEALIDELREEYPTAGDRAVGAAAAKALGRLGDARAVEPLIAALESRLRPTAAEALGRIGDPRAVEPLIAALGDEAWEVRAAAAKALGRLGDARAVEPLIAALRKESTWSSVRSSVVEALGGIGAPAVEALVAALADPSKVVRESVAQALEKLGWQPEDDVQRAQRAIAAGEWDQVREIGPAARGPLLAVLEDEDAHARESAAAALRELRELRGPRAVVVPPLVVSAGLDGTVKVWDPSTGETLHTLEGHTGAVLSCAIAPDGSYVVSTGEDGTLRVWEPSSGELLRTLEGNQGYPGAPRCCAVAPDGSYVVSANVDATLSVWDPSTGEVLRTLEPGVGRIEDCAVAPDGSFVAASCSEGAVLLDPATGQLLQEGPPSRKGPQLRWPAFGGGMRCLTVAPDGSYLVGGGSRDTAGGSYGEGGGFAGGERVGHLCKWDRSTGEILWSTSAQRRGVSACAVAPDGSFLVLAGSISYVDSDPAPLELRKPSDGALIRTLEGHTGAVRSCAVAPDGSYVVSAGVDGTLKLWDPTTGEVFRTLYGHTGGIADCAVA
jgi:HEAT repeat protein